MITKRQREILNLIVDTFVKTHEPVGSKALQEAISLSSATIRNDMAMLEKEGLLEKAHTSSGRLPSQAGFRYFIENCLMHEQQVDEEDLYQIVKDFDREFFKLEDILAQAAQTLVRLTGYTAVVLDVEPKKQTLTSFELVKLSHHDALAVMTLDDTTPVTVHFAIPRNFLDSDLKIFKSLVVERFVGERVIDIHYRLRTELPQIMHRYFRRTDHVLDLFDYVFSEMFRENVMVAGKENALTYSNLRTYQFLDVPQSLALEMRNGLSSDLERTVQIADSQEGSLSHLTVIRQQFLIPYRGMGLMNLIGPIELDYRRVLALMSVISRVLAMKLGDFYRYMSSNHYEVN